MAKKRLVIDFKKSVVDVTGIEKKLNLIEKKEQVLEQNISNKASLNHNHDGRYATEAELKKLGKATTEIIWRGSVGYGSTVNMNKDLRQYNLIKFDFGGVLGNVFFSNPLVYPMEKSTTNFRVVLTDTWGGTVHNVNAVSGVFSYTGFYNGAAHAENALKRVIGIKF